VGEVMSARRDVAVAVSANLRREDRLWGRRRFLCWLRPFFLRGSAFWVDDFFFWVVLALIAQADRFLPGFHFILHALNDFGEGGGEVLFFGDIGNDVVKFKFAGCPFVEFVLVIVPGNGTIFQGFFSMMPEADGGGAFLHLAID